MPPRILIPWRRNLDSISNRSCDSGLLELRILDSKSHHSEFHKQQIPKFPFADYLTLDEICSTQHRLDNGNFISSVSNLSFLCLLIHFVVVAAGLFGDHVYFLSLYSQSCDIKNNALLVFILDRGSCDWGKFANIASIHDQKCPLLRTHFLIKTLILNVTKHP